MDSKYEELFAEWLNELGVHFIEQPEFNLFDGLKVNNNIQLKTKVRTDDKTLLQSTNYTADFKVKWPLCYKGILYSELSDYWNTPFVSQDGISIVEIKSAYDYKNSKAMSRLRIKFLYATQGIYTNVIEPKKLFSSYFFPQSSCYKQNGKLRKNKIDIVTWLKESAKDAELLLNIKQNSSVNAQIQPVVNDVLKNLK